MQITLRPWRIDDLDTLVNLANNKNIARFMADIFPHPYTHEKGKAFIEFANSNGSAFILAITMNDQPVGSIGLHAQTDISRKNYEIGYWLGEPYWGKGIIGIAIEEIVKQGFEKLDCNRIFARVFGTNTASQKAILKAGFVLEATFEKTFYKNGEFLDELIYAIRKQTS